MKEKNLSQLRSSQKYSGESQNSISSEIFLTSGEQAVSVRRYFFIGKGTAVRFKKQTIVLLVPNSYSFLFGVYDGRINWMIQFSCELTEET